jgi:hypothetical protein
LSWWSWSWTSFVSEPGSRACHSGLARIRGKSRRMERPPEVQPGDCFGEKRTRPIHVEPMLAKCKAAAEHFTWRSRVVLTAL